MKLIFATHNPGKLEEIRQLLAGLDIEALSAEEAGVTEDVVEDGETFEENSMKKARFVAEQTGEWAVADDSGLCIEAFDGRPGIRSARWSNGQDLAEFTLEQLKDVPEGKRQAYFQTAAVLVAPDGRHWIFDGKIDGELTLEKRGVAHEKLPYDSIFLPIGETETFAQMAYEKKIALSHRGQAFRKLKDFLASVNISNLRKEGI